MILFEGSYFYLNSPIHGYLMDILYDLRHDIFKQIHPGFNPSFPNV